MQISPWTMTNATTMQATELDHKELSSLSTKYASAEFFNHNVRSITAVSSSASGHSYVIYILAFTALSAALLISADVDFSFASNTVRKLAYLLRKVYLVFSR